MPLDTISFVPPPEGLVELFRRELLRHKARPQPVALLLQRRHPTLVEEGSPWLLPQ